jgi:hypothetical protein
MKCNLVQTGQTIDSKVSFGKGGLLSFSHVWTFRPVAGHVRHLGILQPAATCPIEENQYPVDQRAGRMATPDERGK